MDDYETKARFNIAETCCASISLDDLVQLSGDKKATGSSLIPFSTPMTYGEIPGLKKLRVNIAKLYYCNCGCGFGTLF
jgi:hypothetical protein